jgi:hypothetical protein
MNEMVNQLAVLVGGCNSQLHAGKTAVAHDAGHQTANRTAATPKFGRSDEAFHQIAANKKRTVKSVKRSKDGEIPLDDDQAMDEFNS